jgi:leucyl-tRNA synthetase
MGHMRVYTIGDVIARSKMLQGFNVLHPMGWDSFGMPAENYAIKHDVHPQVSTLTNINVMKNQMKRLGCSYDWSLELTSCLPDYYRRTQELFLLFFERGLAYKKKSGVNWCVECETVLANEQVENGVCWRCGTEVIKKDMSQWFFKITDYAERLLNDLEKLTEWPDKVKVMQANWIGKSHGASINFALEKINETFSVFTTRPDTVYGVSYVVLAPEHELVSRLIAGTEREEEIQDWIVEIRKRSEMERTATDAEKVGLFTGAYALHPLTGDRVPIWIANYVLPDYGTGAVMGVPGHDEHDFEFATKYQIPITYVIKPESEEPTGVYTGSGLLINSDKFNGLNNEEAYEQIVAYLEKIGAGKRFTTYRLRDWLISRQRYWGTPIPIIECPCCGIVPVPKDQLPVQLPEKVDFTIKGKSPLAGNDNFVNTTCPRCQNPAKRETDTMDTFIDSSWYYLRYTSNHRNDEEPFLKEEVSKWLPVDKYIGGIEHAVLHLLYSRFFMKVLYDANLVNVDEPFKSLLTQGMIVKNGAKMSKSKGNGVSPEEIINQYGADTARLFILFAAPPDRDLEWSDQGIEGINRFLGRIWRMVINNLDLLKGNQDLCVVSEAAKNLRSSLHATIKKGTEDMTERYQFNTAISAIMELVNSIYAYPEDAEPAIKAEAIRTALLLLYPAAPHITSELWEMIGETKLLHQQEWPKYDAALLTLDEIEYAIQINGKVRDRIVFSKNASKEEIEAAVRELAYVQKHIGDLSIKKLIVVPGKLVNIVVG